MCEREDFGNCDPETADQEYCIFHRPNKSEEEAREFYNKFMLRFFGYKLPQSGRWVFAKPVDASGFVFPKFPKTTNPQRKTGEEFSFESILFSSLVNFSNAVFENSVVFRGVTFEGVKSNQSNSRFLNLKLLQPKFLLVNDISAIFDNAQFLGSVVFDNVIFSGNVYFSKSLFEEGAIFKYSTLLGDITFEDAKFNINSFQATDLIDEIEEFDRDVYTDPFLPFLRQNNISIVFYNVRFNKTTKFDRAILAGSWFNGTTFHGYVSFSKTIFKERADFMNTVFYIDVEFSGAIFERDVSFDETHFKKGAKFLSCEFNGSADFQNCEFIETQVPALNNEWYSKFETTFANSKFKDVVTFNFAQFGKAIFNFAVFEKEASFKNVTFYDEAWFRETKFREPVEFHDAIFIGDAKFESASFGGLAEFYSAEFRGETTFDGSIFERLAVFVEQKDTDEKEPKPKFHDELSFSNCDFRQGVDFLGSLKEEKNLSTLWNFFNSRFSKLPALIEALRIQRLSFEKECKRDEADRMFVLEMRAKRRLRKFKLSENATQKATSIWGVRQLWNFQNRLTSWLFDSSDNWTELLKLLIAIGPMVIVGLILTLSIVTFQFLYLLGYIGEVVLGDWISLYGTSWERVLGASFLAIFGSAEGFWIGQKLDLGAVCLQSNVTQSGVICEYHIHTFKDALYYSLVTFTTLGYGDMHPTGWLKALSGIEALTGAVFMALIVAVIARKWMR